MKWIGQHIWDFISRFRSDVYLEGLGQSSNTNVLVVDSDGKISKNGKYHRSVYTVYFEHNNTNKTWMPIAGTGADYPNNGDPSLEYPTTYVVAPFDGLVNSVRFNSGSATAGTIQIKFHKNASATATGTTYNIASFNLGKSNEVLPVDWTFSKGDTLFFSMQPSANKETYNATIVITYDINT
mgnify:CR=1 FL=1|tara:strand:+ start:3801 stop:4346 length:546 start_codon:yes stop_codon:yes gene_type:complete